MVKRKRKQKHTTCRIGFEDRAGHLHNVIVRVSSRMRETRETILRLAQLKTGIKPARLVSSMCSGVRGGVNLPHVRRKR